MHNADINLNDDDDDDDGGEYSTMSTYHMYKQYYNCTCTWDICAPVCTGDDTAHYYYVFSSSFLFSSINFFTSFRLFFFGLYTVFLVATLHCMVKAQFTLDWTIHITTHTWDSTPSYLFSISLSLIHPTVFSPLDLNL